MQKWKMADILEMTNHRSKQSGISTCYDFEISKLKYK